MAKARLLICFAHPDDESFGLGAAIPKWIDDGVEVFLACATDGGAGVVPPHLQGKFDTVAALRLSELACARRFLKFTDVFLLGYKDSGMPGSESLAHPDCLWQAWQSDPDGVCGAVADVMRSVRPQVVVTFNRYGGYGHPDHIAIQRAASAAFFNLRQAEPPHPQKLYYTATPKFPVRMRIWRALLSGQDPRRMGYNNDVDVTKTLSHMEPVHARIPIADYLPIWEAASRCHASQGGGRISRTSRLLRRLLYSQQGFTRAFPQPSRDRVDEQDLFAGVAF